MVSVLAIPCMERSFTSSSHACLHHSHFNSVLSLQGLSLLMQHKIIPPSPHLNDVLAYYLDLFPSQNLILPRGILFICLLIVYLYLAPSRM